MQSNILRAEIVPIDALRPYAKSARKHSAAQRERLAGFTERYGQVDPIIVGDDGEIVDGHLLFEVLRDAGKTHVAVRRASEFSAEELSTLRIARNQLSRGSSWDSALLTSELQALQELAIDLSATTLSDEELNRLLQDSSVEVDKEVAPLVSRPGDIWILGRHRVADGSSFSDLCDLLPKGLIRVAWLNEALATGDSNTSVPGPGRPQRDIGPALTMLSARFHDGAAIFVPCQALDMGPVLRTASEHQLQHVATAVVPRSAPVGGGLYESEYVPVCVFRYGTAEFVTTRRRSPMARGDFWKSYNEGTTVANNINTDIIADALRDSSRKGDVVVDVALGDGSTLLAAETTGRICIGLGLAPPAIDIAIRNWEQLSGDVARHAKSGLTFLELARVRGEAGLR